MNVLGCIGDSSFVLAIGGGRGRVMTIDDEEVVVSNAHPLDPHLTEALDPCHVDPRRAIELAELVLREGTAEGTGFPGENVSVLPRTEAERRVRLPLA